MSALREHARTFRNALQSVKAPAAHEKIIDKTQTFYGTECKQNGKTSDSR